MDRRRGLAISVASVLALLMANTAWAQAQSASDNQTTGNEAAAGQSKGGKIEEVVVSARRTEESQQKVPVAVSAVSGDRLIDAAVSSVSDLQRLVPSLQIRQSVFGTTDFLIRGSFAGFSVDPSVITYLDEVPIDSRLLAYDTFDLSSAQELKGPQGTLFGKNSTGGAVLFFSRKPDFSELGGYIDVRYGNYNDRRLEGAINIPASDTLAFRVAGEWEKRDGTLTSVTTPGLQFNNRNNYAIRASMLWQPSDSFSDYAQVSIYKTDENPYPRVPISIQGPCTGPTTPALTCLYAPPFNSVLGTDDLYDYVQQQLHLPHDKVVQDIRQPNNVQRDAVTNTMTWDLGGASIRNTTYVAYSSILFAQDFDGTPADVLQSVSPSNDHTIYNETQIYGKLFDDRLDWRVGAVYSQDVGQDRDDTIVFPFPVSLTTPDYIHDKTNFRSYAIFGQATYDLSKWLDGVSLTAGYRYTWDHRTLATQNYGGAPTPVCQLQTLPVPATGAEPYPGTDLSTCTRNLTLNSSSANYNFTASWQATDRLLVYAATRKGYQAGGFNTYPPPGPDSVLLATYAPEVVRDIEVGLKADWNAGEIPLRTNVALFDAWYTNIQISQTYIAPDGAASIVIENRNPITGEPNKANMKGFEAELTALPLSWLELTAFYSRVFADFTQYTTVTGADLAGQHVDGVTPVTWGLTSQAELPIHGPFESLDLTASYYWTAPQLRNSTSVSAQAGVKSIDMRLEAHNVFGTQASLAIYGKNLGNNISCNYDPVVSGENTEACTDPKTYGVELRYEFGGG
jgi:iron complex outermembrane receptor protein